MIQKVAKKFAHNYVKKGMITREDEEVCACTLCSYSGGYHADTHMKCIAAFVGSFIIILNFVKYVDSQWSSYICVLLLFCNTMIFLFCSD